MESGLTTRGDRLSAVADRSWSIEVESGLNLRGTFQTTARWTEGDSSTKETFDWESQERAVRRADKDAEGRGRSLPIG